MSVFLQKLIDYQAINGEMRLVFFDIICIRTALSRYILFKAIDQ